MRSVRQYYEYFLANHYRLQEELDRALAQGATLQEVLDQQFDALRGSHSAMPNTRTSEAVVRLAKANESHRLGTLGIGNERGPIQRGNNERNGARSPCASQCRPRCCAAGHYPVDGAPLFIVIRVPVVTEQSPEHRSCQGTDAPQRGAQKQPKTRSQDTVIRLCTVPSRYR
jgi:hypothetical protein